MPVEIDAFLDAYRPRFICLSCLVVVTARTGVLVDGSGQSKTSSSWLRAERPQVR